jgi:chemotaxis protein MotB
VSRSRLFLFLVPVIVFSLLPACVRRGTHEVALTDLAQARSDQEALARDMSAALEERDRREAALAEEIRAHQLQVSRLEGELSQLERQLWQTEGALTTASNEVARLDVLLGERGAEFRALQTRLEALGQVEREIRERNRIYEEMLDRFQSMIDAGRLSVSIERGRMVIQLPQDILFPSGSATVSPDGVRTLADVGSVLADVSDRTFQVEGHTDDVPISTERFPSNWELSSARAMSVIRVLLNAGVPPGNISGAGYGEFQPVASNETAEGRRLNRRIEIVMLPNLDVIATTGVPE